MVKEKIKEIIIKLDKVSKECKDMDFYVAMFLYVRYGISTFEKYIDNLDIKKINAKIKTRTTLFAEELSYEVDKIINAKEQ